MSPLSQCTKLQHGKIAALGVSDCIFYMQANFNLKAATQCSQEIGSCVGGVKQGY